ncbi:MAG: 2-keto-4-pentenoate hydratase, partial [Alphaproteobacteria bacterium]|nr:2-keto-4-pentenoate hydratase [Alphaproteobacteria bacterium]
RRLGEAIGGWKVGAGSAASAAFCAPIGMKTIRPSPASYQARELRLIGIEAEIALRLGRDLPARSAAHDRSEVTAGAALHPVIEVVDSRYSDPRSLDRLSILADNFSNGGLVYGAAVLDWEKLDLGQTRITVTEDGEPFADSAGATSRDPVAALVDFANLMNSRGGTKAGTFVTTGSWTGMVFTKRGTRIVADFGPLGRVEVTFPADE